MQDEFASFRDHVATALSQVDGLQMRSMFGGFGLVKDGQMIGLLYRDHLYLRTKPETRAEFESRGMREYRAFGRPAKELRGYMQVPQDVVSNAAELQKWTTAAAPEVSSLPERHELPRPIRRRR